PRFLHPATIGDGHGRQLRRRDRKEIAMDTQRNDIGDRAAPVEAPESTPAPDPSIRQDDTRTEGGVEQPGGQSPGSNEVAPAVSGAIAPAVQTSRSPRVRRQVTSDTSDTVQKPSLKKRAPASITPIGPLEQKQAE